MNGRILDQCTKDAWDIISGRKKIVGNKIVPCRDDKKEEKKENDYGWLAPDGTFYSVEFGCHQAWATEFLVNEYRSGNKAVKVSYQEESGDKLCEMGFILIHNPHGYNLSITRDLSKRITTRQKAFLIDYFNKRGLTEWSYKLSEDRI